MDLFWHKSYVQEEIMKEGKYNERAGKYHRYQLEIQKYEEEVLPCREPYWQTQFVELSKKLLLQIPRVHILQAIQIRKGKRMLRKINPVPLVKHLNTSLRTECWVRSLCLIELQNLEKKRS